MSGLFIETDNALGSFTGDVDDGIALTQLLISKVKINAITSIYGNTKERDAYKNTKNLLSYFNSSIPVLHGPENRNDTTYESIDFLKKLNESFAFMALGPLTSLAALVKNHPEVQSKIEKVYIVGGNLTSKGFLPPFWPMEFNLYLDRKAADTVINKSDLNIQLVTLEQAKRLTFTKRIKDVLKQDVVGNYILKNVKCWQLRNLILKQKMAFPIWDLVATLSYTVPELFSYASENVLFQENGLIKKHPDGREVEVIKDFDSEKVIEAFLLEFSRRSIS